MKGRNLVIPPKNWLRSPQAQLLVSRGPCKPSSASLTPEGHASPLIIRLPSQGAPDAWCPCPPLQLFCDSAVSPPPFPYSFLSLAGNRIRQVENLRDLPHLQFLDLSENLIEILKLGRNVLALAHGISPGGALPPLCSPSPCPHYQHVLRVSGGLCKEAVALDRKVGVRTSLFLSLPCADEFPESLLILNLTGNSCTNQESYR